MKLIELFDRYFIRNPRLRRVVTRLLYGNKDVSVKLFDAELLVNTTRENGYYRAARMCRTSSLLRDEVSVMFNLAALMNNGDTFVDIGANVGIYSSCFSRFKKLWPEFHMYAFEANPDTFTRLQPLADKLGVISYNVGLSNISGRMKFIEGAVSHVFTNINNRTNYNIDGEVVEIECKPLSEYDLVGNSLVLKIDVEGQEYEVLLGAEPFFRDDRVKAVYVDGFSKVEVVDFLKKYGFILKEGRSLADTDGKVFSLLAVSPHILGGGGVACNGIHLRTAPIHLRNCRKYN